MNSILIRLLILVAIGYVLYRFLWKGDIGFPWFKKAKKNKKPHPQAALQEMRRDPVCGTYIPENQAIKLKVKKETLFFCSEECKKEFEEKEE